eukprot:357339_1
MTPTVNWKHTLHVKQFTFSRKRRRMHDDGASSPPNRKRMKMKLSHYERKQIVTKIKHQEQYTVADVDEYDPWNTHYHATRYQQKRESHKGYMPSV